MNVMLLAVGMVLLGAALAGFLVARKLKIETKFPSVRRKPKPKDEREEVVTELPVSKTMGVRMIQAKGNKRVTVRRLKMKKRDAGKYFVGVKGQYHYFEPTPENIWTVRDFRGKFHEEMVYDIRYCEPLHKDGDKAYFSQKVERDMIDDYMVQHIEVASTSEQFTITKRLIVILTVAALFTAFFGLSLNSVFHITPDTIVHWIPGIPR